MPLKEFIQICRYGVSLCLAIMSMAAWFGAWRVLFLAFAGFVVMRVMISILIRDYKRALQAYQREAARLIDADRRQLEKNHERLVKSQIDALKQQIETMRQR